MFFDSIYCRCNSVSSGFRVQHIHTTTSPGCALINVVTFVQQERGLSSSTTLWSLRGLTSVPKAQQFNDRVHNGIVKVKVPEKLGTSGPHWAEKYVAFSILRTEIFYTAETLYVDACLRAGDLSESIYRYKKASICWSTCGGFNFDLKHSSFFVRSWEESTHGSPFQQIDQLT